MRSALALEWCRLSARRERRAPGQVTLIGAIKDGQSATASRFSFTQAVAPSRVSDPLPMLVDLPAEITAAGGLSCAVVVA